MIKSIIVLILFLLFISCASEYNEQKPLSNEEIKEATERIFNVNKAQVKKEKAEIEDYIKRKKLNVETSGTGLRYMITKSSEGKQAQAEMQATIEYRVELLDGTLCYSSEEQGPRTFIIDHDNVESGIHEGVKLLREGEHAIFILPSHLAFGLTGNHDKVPPATPLAYSIDLIQLK